MDDVVLAYMFNNQNLSKALVLCYASSDNYLREGGITLQTESDIEVPSLLLYCSLFWLSARVRQFRLGVC